MDHIIESLLGLAPFAQYFFSSLALLLIFKWVYILVTPHDEWKLVKEDNNVAAAAALVGSFIGFSLALASAAQNSVSLIDFWLWATVALLAQIIAFLIIRFVFIPKISQRIENNELSSGLILGGFSIAVGILNGACMTY
ncbi:MAG: DUF350 domain-containing protein [Methylococcales bacterium]|nr:DUF350 domain-containing protein [Methylococcales bacterium]